MNKKQERLKMKLDLEIQQEVDVLYRESLLFVEKIKQAEYNVLKTRHEIGMMLVKKRVELNLKRGQIRRFLLDSSLAFDIRLDLLKKCMLFAAKCPGFEEFWQAHQNEEFLDIDYVVNVVLRNVPSKFEYWKEKMISEKACLFCGNSLAGKPFDAKFCSAKCRKKFHKRKTKAPA